MVAECAYSRKSPRCVVRMHRSDFRTKVSLTLALDALRLNQLWCRAVVTIGPREPIPAGGYLFTAQVDFEIEQRMILLERAHIWNIEMRSVEQVELSLQIEIQQALHDMVRRNNAPRNRRLLRLLLRFHPVFVATDSCSPRRNRERCPVLCSRILFPVFCNYIRNIIRSQRAQSLSIVLGHCDIQSNLREVDFHAIVRIIADDRIDGHNPRRKRRLLWKLRLVTGRIRPGLRGNGYAFVRFERGSLHRALGLLCTWCKAKKAASKKGNYDG